MREMRHLTIIMGCALALTSGCAVSHEQAPEPHYAGAHLISYVDDAGCHDVLVEHTAIVYPETIKPLIAPDQEDFFRPSESCGGASDWIDEYFVEADGVLYHVIDSVVARWPE